MKTTHDEKTMPAWLERDEFDNQLLCVCRSAGSAESTIKIPLLCGAQEAPSVLSDFMQMQRGVPLQERKRAPASLRERWNWFRSTR